MEGGDLSSAFMNGYNAFLYSLSPFSQSFVNLFLLLLVIFLYSLFVWKFHKFIARKNILHLDLKQYNNFQHPLSAKLLAGFFYFLEYLIIIPFIIFFVFAILSFFMISLTENLNVNTIFIISAVTTAVIRVTAYYKEEMSKELAKLIPLELLALAFFTAPDLSKIIEKMIGSLSELPNVMGNIFYYLAFIVIIEMLLRLFDFIFSLFGLEEENEEQYDD
jgi:hypothetical protein